jgi:hypothetical protein
MIGDMKRGKPILLKKDFPSKCFVCKGKLLAGQKMVVVTSGPVVHYEHAKTAKRACNTDKEKV